MHNNAKSETKSRNRFVFEDPSTYYREDEFCYENYEPFIVKGALDIFSLPMSKIRKYCKALISTIFISLGSIILGGIFVCLHNDCLMSLALLFYIFFVLGFILSIVFAIILIHYYSKGNYNDFEEFSRCRYLSKSLKKDYDFVFTVKSDYKLPFAVIIITEFFSFVKLIAEYDLKKYQFNIYDKLDNYSILE